MLKCERFLNENCRTSIAFLEVAFMQNVSIFNSSVTASCQPQISMFFNDHSNQSVHIQNTMITMILILNNVYSLINKVSVTPLFSMKNNIQVIFFGDTLLFPYIMVCTKVTLIFHKHKLSFFFHLQLAQHFFLIFSFTSFYCVLFPTFCL